MLRSALAGGCPQGVGVETRRDWGTYLASVDPAELAEARLAIEPLVARLAAERHGPGSDKRVVLLLNRLREAVEDAPAFAAADLELHAELVWPRW